MYKYLTLKNVIRASCAILLFVGFFFMFFNQVDVTYSGKMSFSEAFFGKYGSPLTFVGYLILLLSSFTTGGMILLNVQEEKKKVIYFIVVGILLVAAIFLFIEGAVITNNIGQNGINARLLLPPVLAGVFAVISSLALCFAEFVSDKQLG